MVTLGTRIPVVASADARFVSAPLDRVAKVVGARIAVIAVQRYPVAAHTVAACLSRRTGISIVAGKPGPFRNHAAFPGGGLTEGVQAVLVRTLRFGTFHNGTRHHCAEVGKRVVVAEKNAVALVAVIQIRTILVGIALAGDRVSLAVPLITMVPHGAGVGIVAGFAVEFKDASFQLVAEIVRALVAVIAGNLGPDAVPLITMVGESADISVGALCPVQRFVGTAAIRIT